MLILYGPFVQTLLPNINRFKTYSFKKLLHGLLLDSQRKIVPETRIFSHSIENLKNILSQVWIDPKDIDLA